MKSFKRSSDAVLINLLDYQHFQINKVKRYLFLNPEQIKEIYEFLTITLSQTKKCIIMLPPDVFLEDFVEIFDMTLVDENLQKYFLK